MARPKKADQVKKAVKMMRRNPDLSAPQAAARAGVHHTTIYRSSQYKALMAERKEQAEQQ
jgi:hypothetical protein